GWRGGGRAALGAAVPGWESPMRGVAPSPPPLRPDHLRDVRYEALVRDPPAELERICDFAGLRAGRAVEKMLTRPRGGRLTGDWHENVAAPVDAGLADRWRERLAPHQGAPGGDVAGPSLDGFGAVRAPAAAR